MKGIYKIENTENGKMYIGSSKNIHKRWTTHRRSLSRGSHHNIYLQRSVDKYGMDKLAFSVIEECDDLFDREEYYISTLNPEYNIGSIGGGDNISNHPNRDIIIEKLSKNLRDCPRPKPRFGSDNPNWKGGPKKCECGVIIAKSAKSCSGCRDRSGSNNPFYGKSHSEELRNKFSNSMKGIPNLISRKPLNTPDGEFDSLSQAAEFYNRTPGAILYRINSDKEKWSEYYYLNA